MDIKGYSPVNWKQLLHDDAGATAMEYALLAALASVVGILAALALTSKM